LGSNFSIESALAIHKEKMAQHPLLPEGIIFFILRENGFNRLSIFYSIGFQVQWRNLCKPEQ